MRMLLGLIDRLLFAAGFALAMQLPQFVDAYTQRYGGYHQALVDSMAEYQRNADEHYGGDIDKLIADLHAAPAAGIHDIGDKLQRDRAHELEMRNGLQILEHETLARRLVYLAGHLDADIARAAWASFQPGLPLSFDALLCGLVGAVLFSGLFNLLRWPFSLWRRRNRRSSMPAAAKPAPAAPPAPPKTYKPTPKPPAERKAPTL
ncbi:DUF2937 family protein [Solimonas marina]|uniref:DUF2937 family protein n=1 Tax=Solimonas marina TaxID=2714601 RepID=A0A969WAE8_9GAMM|nr:DUF2937 family protein [Solimonas marina]NKF21871.1 DUF2937 family protein [Solimonas marina]